MRHIGSAATIELATELHRRDGKRHALDTYLTSAAIAVRMIDAGFRAWRNAGGNLSHRKPIRIADLGAGVGIFGFAAKIYFKHLGLDCPVEVHGFDLNPAYRRTHAHDTWTVCDVLTYDFGDQEFDIIAMNPPFDTETMLGFIRVARGLLSKAGQLLALLPARFEFHRLSFFREGHYFKRRIVLDRRPSFYQLLLDGNPNIDPIPTKKDKKGKWVIPSRRQTDVHECCVFCFDAEDRYPDEDDFWEWEFDPMEIEDYKESFPGEALVVRKAHLAAQASRNMPVYAMIYEASRTPEGEIVWDDLFSLMAARSFGWSFYKASPKDRATMRLSVRKVAQEAASGAD